MRFPTGINQHSDFHCGSFCSNDSLVATRILVSPLVSLVFFRLSLLLAVLQLCVCTQPLTVPFVLVSHPCSVSVSGFVLYCMVPSIVLLPVSKECLPRTFRRVSLLCSL